MGYLGHSWLSRSVTRRTALALFGTTALAVGGSVLLPGCSDGFGVEGDGAATRLLVKVPRTGHDVVFDEYISEVSQVIETMARAFEAQSSAAVHVEVEVFEQNQYEEAIVGSFDGEHAVDLLYGDYFNMSTYIHSGHVVPLDDIVDAGIRDDIPNLFWNLSTVEGKVYMMPYLARQNVLAYSKNLFRRAGLEKFIRDGEIQSWSVGEWEEILDTLARELPEDVFPMMMYAGSSQGDTHIMTLLRSYGSPFFDETGHFCLSRPEGIAALRQIQRGGERGWWPPHPENLEIEDCSSLFRNGQLAIYMLNNASVGRYGDAVGLVNFPGGEDGRGCATLFVSGFEVFDNGDAEKVRVAKEFLSFVYHNEELMSYSAGTLPASRAVSQKHGNAIPYYDLFKENSDRIVDFTGNNPDTRAVREIFFLVIHQLLMGNITPEEAARQLDEQCNRAIDEGVKNSTLHE